MSIAMSKEDYDAYLKIVNDVCDIQDMYNEHSMGNARIMASRAAKDWWVVCQFIKAHGLHEEFDKFFPEYLERLENTMELMGNAVSLYE